MKFIQSKDGSCDIFFDEQEIKLINCLPPLSRSNVIFGEMTDRFANGNIEIIYNNNKKLHLPAVTLKHFGNAMAKIIMDWNVNFNDDVKKMMTQDSTKIKGE